jgi:hypothetical protein
MGVGVEYFNDLLGGRAIADLGTGDALADVPL